MRRGFLLRTAHAVVRMARAEIPQALQLGLRTGGKQGGVTPSSAER